MPRPSLDPDSDRWIVSSTELAFLLGEHRAQIKRFAERGMPKRGYGKWYLPDVVQWWRAQVQEQREEIDLDLSKRKAMLYQSQEEKNRIDIAERLYRLIPADEVEDLLATLAQQYIDTLEGIPTRLDLAPDVVSRVEQEVHAARRDLARAVQIAAARLRADHPDRGAAA
jgi:hypothetical protein